MIHSGPDEVRIMSRIHWTFCYSHLELSFYGKGGGEGEENKLTFKYSGEIFIFTFFLLFLLLIKILKIFNKNRINALEGGVRGGGNGRRREMCQL